MGRGEELHKDMAVEFPCCSWNTSEIRYGVTLIRALAKTLPLGNLYKGSNLARWEPNLPRWNYCSQPCTDNSIARHAGMKNKILSRNTLAWHHRFLPLPQPNFPVNIVIRSIVLKNCEQVFLHPYQNFPLILSVSLMQRFNWVIFIIVYHECHRSSWM